MMDFITSIIGGQVAGAIVPIIATLAAVVFGFMGKKSGKQKRQIKDLESKVETLEHSRRIENEVDKMSTDDKRADLGSRLSGNKDRS